MKSILCNMFILFNLVLSSETNIQPDHTMVGGQRDNNNCLIGAGYQWCEETQTCIRHWETPCADNYDNCDDCLSRQRKGENIACPVNCVNQRDTSDCTRSDYIWCPTLNRCINPVKEICNNGMIEPPRGIDLMIPHLLKGTHNERYGYGGEDPVIIPPQAPPPPITACPILYEDCDSINVCPKVTEITHCSEGGIPGHTTYQLSLIIKNPNIYNIYAIFGDLDRTMTIPAAYQVDGIFGSNIGGVSDEIIQLNSNSRYDSWLTIGLTNGDPENKLANIGIPFDEWNSNTPLTIDNGAIFVMDPQELINTGDEYIIGQLTIPTLTDNPVEVIVNVQGETTCNLCENSRWTEYNVAFNLSPPNPVDPNTIPEDCIMWYDGCNSCSVSNGVLGRCTRMMCFREDNPHCLDFGTGH